MIKRFIVQKEGQNVTAYECRGEAEAQAKEIGGKVVVELDDEKFFHCTNCEEFSWWDGDYMCVKDFPYKGDLIQISKDGKFTAEFPDRFNAMQCPHYKWNMGYGNGDLYFNAYFDSLKKDEKKED